VRIELRPGDMLYVPPFWLHHVMASSSSSDDNEDASSISLNAWSDSYEGSVNAMLGAHGMPAVLMARTAMDSEADAKGDLPLTARVKLLVAYVRMLISDVLDETPARFIKQHLLEQRYRALDAALGCDNVDLTKCPVEGDVDAEQLALLDEPLHAVKIIFNVLANVAPDTRHTLLLDFFERVIASVVGENVCSFIHCLADERAWRYT
jgi:hypothetical protein